MPQAAMLYGVANDQNVFLKTASAPSPAEHEKEVYEHNSLPLERIVSDACDDRGWQRQALSCEPGAPAVAATCHYEKPNLACWHSAGALSAAYSVKVNSCVRPTRSNECLAPELMLHTCRSTLIACYTIFKLALLPH